MQMVPGKFDPVTQQEKLELPKIKPNPEEHRKYLCNTLYPKHFPELYESECRGRATAEKYDQVQTFAPWLPNNTAVLTLDQIPVDGMSALPLWSDDYWRIRFGGLSYRYASGAEFPNYTTAMNAYSQPLAWNPISTQPIDAIAAAVRPWSPAEKYDLTLNDESFSLTLQQKYEGKEMMNPQGDVEDWMGICHGWAAAALTVKPPTQPVKVVGAKGTSIEWLPADIKSLASLAWAKGDYQTLFIGRRCTDSNPPLLPNGRLSSPRCFDSNPATFHLALGNLIGIAKKSLIMDVQFDYEVWNQPIQSYHFIYFNPMDHSKKSQKWSEVAVDYNEGFKKIDRFQNPLTRGKKNGTVYQDNAIKKIVGVSAAVVYLNEIEPVASPNPQGNAMTQSNYLYDLELEEVNGQWVATGGEWLHNAHPDFLWLPQAGDFVKSSFDSVQINFTGNETPNSTATQTAAAASKAALPLCQVVKKIFEKSTGDVNSYPCR